MQSTEVQRPDMRLLAIGAVVVVGVIVVAVAWALWPVASQTNAPTSNISATTSVSRVGMGELRAADVINSSQAGLGDLRATDVVNSLQVGMGDVRAADAAGSVQLGIGNLRALEAGISTTAASETVGMGDARMEHHPNALKLSSPGMGDVHSVE